MIQVGATPLIGMAGAPDARETSDATNVTPAPEQAAHFASMLAALVMPRDRAPEATDDATPALSELEATDAEEGEGEAATTATTELPSGAAAPASAESLVAASRAMAASVAASLEPVRSPGALEPEFREKLTRVVERMRELGHEVRIVETVRSQARQDRLYAQGRSEEGPVVTWTRRSRHTDGLAADVMIDGKYDGPGYRTLHRLAAEEGLRTLGARDPGHLELPRAQAIAERGSARGAASSMDATSGRALESLQALSSLGARVERSATEAGAAARPAVARETASIAHVAPAAQPAGIASVARVAEVAQVAQVAQVAAPREVAPGAEPARAAASRRDRSESVGGASDASRPTVAALARDLVRTVTRRRATEDGTDVGAGRDEASARLDQLAQALGPRALAPAASGAGEIGALARTLGGSQLDQVNRVLAAQDAARGRPITELSLALDAAESGVDRVHLGVSGRRVGATIEAVDGASASRLGGRLDELTRALERAGLEPEAVRIAGPESRDVGRELGGRAAQLVEAGRSASTNAHDRQQDDTSRGREAWTQEDRRQQPGGRHRSRRDQQETKQ